MLPIKGKENDRGNSGESGERRNRAHVGKKKVLFTSSATFKRTAIFALILRISIQAVYSLGGKYECRIPFAIISVKSYSKPTAHAGSSKETKACKHSPCLLIGVTCRQECCLVCRSPPLYYATTCTYRLLQHNE